MKNKKYLIITIIGIIIICVLSAKKVFQNDTFYTIKVGESIINNGIDFIDHFSYHNIAYSYPHWLYDVIISFINSMGGFNGLYIYNIISFIILSISFYLINLSINKKDNLVSIISILFTIMISCYIVVRAQSISYILFLFEFYFIKKLLESGKNIYSIILFIIAILICNIHSAVYPLFFILFLPYIVEYFITKSTRLNNLLDKRLLINKEKNIKKLIIVMILSLFAGFITPIKDIPYTYFIKILLGDSQKYILEHQIGFSDLTVTISLIIGIVLLLIFIFKSKEKVKITDVFMILGLTLMSIMSLRHFSFYLILGLICFTSMFICFIKDKNEILNMLFNSKVFLGIVLVEMIIISTTLFINNINNDYIDSKEYPIEATKYLKEHYDINNLRIFNSYNFGSYLLLNDVKVFIDSRADLYTKEFSGKDIFNDYELIKNGNLELLDNYNIDLIFIQKGFFKDISNDKNYNKVYEDDSFILYETK